MSQSIRWLLIAITVGLQAVGAQIAYAQSTTPRIELIVPAYFYPGNNEPNWPALTQAVKRIPITAILNPNSGPGSAIDPNYVIATRAFKRAGGQLIGYVHTNYAKRSIADVTDEMQRYMAWYPIDGFFIDEMSNQEDPVALTYYKHLFDYAKRMNTKRKYRVIGNPGTNTSASYLSFPVADALVITEVANRRYLRYPVAQWASQIPASRLGHLSYGIRDADAMRETVADALRRNAGLIYVTNDNLPNPWDSLPPYWTQQVNCVVAVNQGSPRC